jgi:hypothetical protein
MSGETRVLAGSQTPSDASKLFVESKTQTLNSAGGMNRSRSKRKKKYKTLQGIKISNIASWDLGATRIGRPRLVSAK